MLSVQLLIIGCVIVFGYLSLEIGRFWYVFIMEVYVIGIIFLLFVIGEYVILCVLFVNFLFFVVINEIMCLGFVL